MTIERTLSIVKPDAVAKNVIGNIYTLIESSGLKIVAAAMTRLDRASAEDFYDIHRNRPFFNDLVKFMSSGPVMIQVLEGENAVAKYRELMGATDPKQAAPGTIRALYGASIDANAVHGSDSLENARKEIAFFFGDEDDEDEGEDVIFDEFEYEEGDEDGEEFFGDDDEDDEECGDHCGHKH